MLLGTIEGNGTATRTVYYHSDHLGSTQVVTDQSGSVVETLDYYPYGGSRMVQGGYQAVRGYIGEFADAESSLSYLNARYYDGGRGQFLSQDPVFWGNQMLSDPQSMNSYSYANNNPINRKDPLGLFNIKTGLIEKGDTLSAIRNQINTKFGTSLSLLQLASGNNIKDVNKIIAGKYITLPFTNIELRFDNKTLQVFDKTYNIGSPTLKWSGTSGNSKSSPISEGTWNADPKDTQKWSDLSTANKVGSTLSSVLGPVRGVFSDNSKVGAMPGGTAAWGNQRTELSNQSGTRGYYIHGGWTAGSAGCIDLTSSNDAFHKWLSEYNKPVDVIVDY